MQAQNFVQLELPGVLPKKNDTLKQIEEAMQGIST
jgi:hypothetical protein